MFRRTGWLWWVVGLLSVLPPAFAIHRPSNNTVTLSTAAGHAGDVRVVTVSLANSDTLAGLQFNIRYAPNNLKATAVTPLSRLSSFDTTFNDTRGMVIILSLGSLLLPGSGPIFTITYRVANPAVSARTPMIFDLVVVADKRAHTVRSFGVNGVFDILPPVSVIAHPKGQPANLLASALSPATGDLYRFGLSIPFSTARIDRLAFYKTLTDLSVSDLSRFELYEDIGGDGVADGSAIPATATMIGDSLIFSGLNLSLGSPAPQYYQVRGTVRLPRLGVQMALNLGGRGVSGTFVTTDYTEPIKQSAGQIAGALHTVEHNAVGDVNGDFRLNVTDVVRVVRVIIGTAQIEGDIRTFDVDANGRVDVSDVVTIIQRILF